ncbi:MAG TPA: DinB family protein [Bryobacteraceae bacterium]|nr:DinB family protein [Bryobacteraceae bacterium]
MSPKPQTYDIAAQLLASQDFFNRSTRVLEEGDSQFAPYEGMMTVAQQVAHAAQTLEWFVQGVTRPEGFDLDFAKHAQEIAAVTSLAAARAWLEKAYASSVAFLRSQSPEELAKPMREGPILGGQPLSALVWAMVEHTAHHRGALTVYSRALGKVPPMPYGG